jgi:RNA polymerase sigma factor (sigma-70 family)
MKSAFHDEFAAIFDANFRRVYRYLDRLSGEPELAADLAQDTFVSLYQRGCAPDTPEAWLITVATNLLRNAQSQRARRAQLLTAARGAAVLSDPLPSPAQELDAAESCQCVRRAIDTLPERERSMLLLRAEGFSYRDIAAALQINEGSVGTLLARAKRAFRDRYEGDADASR